MKHINIMKFFSLNSNIQEKKWLEQDTLINNGFSLQAVKTNQNIAIKATILDTKVLEFVPIQWLNDKSFMFKTIQQNGQALQYASSELQNDKELVLEAIKQSGLYLSYASDELKNDRVVVLEAVKQNGQAIEYASGVLRNDREVVTKALENNSIAILYASDELKSNRDFILEAVKIDGYIVRYASAELRNDKEIIIQSIQNSGLIKQLSDLQKSENNIINYATTLFPILNYASESLKENPFFVLDTIKNYYQNISTILPMVIENLEANISSKNKSN